MLHNYLPAGKAKARDDATRVKELKIHLKDVYNQLAAANRAGDLRKAAALKSDIRDLRQQIEEEGGWWAKDEPLSSSLERMRTELSKAKASGNKAMAERLTSMIRQGEAESERGYDTRK